MNLFGKKRIFLDHAAGEENPSGIHQEGAAARRELESARARAARVLECQARDIIFTSGGTESDNLALFGVVEASKEAVPKPHIVISSVEHPAVRECAKELERRGCEVTVVDVEDGVVPPQAVTKALRENTVLVSIMYVNNETGAINDVPKISRLVADFRRKRGGKYPYIHTDASQAAACLPVDISRLGADLVTLDASKIGGPKSLGLLVVRPNVTIRPQLLGGSQERGLRAGTPNARAASEFASSLESAARSREEVRRKADALKRTFVSELARLAPQAVINSPVESVPNIVSVSFPGALHEFLAVKLDERGVAVSTGSSCSSSKDEEEKEALRFSFGPGTREREVREAARVLSEIVI